MKKMELEKIKTEEINTESQKLILLKLKNSELEDRNRKNSN